MRTCFLLLCVIPSLAYANIYEHTSTTGVIELTSTPLRGYRMVMRTNTDRATDRMHAHFSPVAPGRTGADKFMSTIRSASSEYGVSPDLIRAVITAESGFSTTAVSDSGAMGLMQLMPSTAYRLGVSRPFDPRQNIYAGTRYLAHLIGYFGSTRLALAAYNSGSQAVIDAGWSIPPYAQTRKYVPEVLGYYNAYKGAR